jgi:FkbM family methyltransferase
MANILAKLRRAGVELVALDEQFDTADGRGEAIGKVLDLLSRWNPVDAQPGNGWTPANLRLPGLHPATVIDVGVGSGTGGLYTAFPDAHLVLIEPLEEFEQALKTLTRTYGGEYVLTALGATEGTSTIHIHRSRMLSSIMTGIKGEQDAERREIPITTLDSLVSDRGWKAPFGLKLDVEGYERHVIEGATETLRETQFVIAELSISPRFEQDWTTGQFIELMRSHGFAVQDILDATRAYADVRFCRAS